MKCREMLPSDVEIVAGIEAANFSEPWSVNSFYQELEDVNFIFLVVEEASHVIGYLGMQCSLDEADITTIAVEQSFRRKGAAHLLFDTAFAKCKQRGISRINLEARVSNYAAINMYDKLGFKRVGMRKRFYRFPTEDALVMTRFL